MSTAPQLLAEAFKQALECDNNGFVAEINGGIPQAAAEIASRKPRKLIIAVQQSINAPEKSPGLDLLLWLRLKEKVRCPILLIGFLPSEEVVLRDMSHILLHAPGNKYVRLPVPWDQWPDLKAWIESPEMDETIFQKGYAPYLRAGFNLEQFRHSLANKFGLKCAWDMQNLVREREDPYPAKLDKALASEKDLLIASALHPLPQNDLSRIIRERTGVERTRREVLISNITALEQSVIEHSIDRSEALECSMEYLASAEALRAQSSNPELTQADRALMVGQADQREGEAEGRHYEAIRMNEAVELDSMSLPSLEDELSAVMAELRSIVNVVRNEVLGEIHVPRISPDQKVLHIDDELELGWDDLLKKMVDPVNGDPTGYRALQPRSKKVKGIENEALLAIKEHEPDVILLDLRLLGQEEPTPTPDAPPSGIHVLRAIRAKHRTVPIIITTASNKMWSYRLVMREGADGYWMKQGVELGWGSEEVLENDIALRQMIAAADHPLVRAMRKLERLHHWMGTAVGLWWRGGHWANGNARLGETEDARRILRTAMAELQAYCRKRLFEGTGSTDRKVVGLGLSGICNRLGSAAERIVAAPNIGSYSYGIGRTTDPAFKYVWDTRNDASHHDADVKITVSRLLDQIAALDDFLRSPLPVLSGTP